MGNREKIMEVINKYSLNHLMLNRLAREIANDVDHKGKMELFMGKAAEEAEILANKPDVLAGFIYNYVITNASRAVFRDIGEKEMARNISKALHEDDFCEDLAKSVEKIVGRE